MISHLFVGQEKSVQAVDAASERQPLHLHQHPRKDETVDDPSPEDLYQTGTVAMIMRMLKMPDGRLKMCWSRA